MKQFPKDTEAVSAHTNSEIIGFQKGVLSLKIKEEHLAIASVPVQNWGALYSRSQALKAGTVFLDLDLPFWAADSSFLTESCREEQGMDTHSMDGETLMEEIQKVSFFLDDLRLYLDTHPEDPEGLAAFQTALGQRKQLMTAFAVRFYPLTQDCMTDVFQQKPMVSGFCWQEGAAPWEGGEV